LNFAPSIFHSGRKKSRAFYNKGDKMNIKILRIVGRARTDFRKHPEEYAGAQSELSH